MYVKVRGGTVAHGQPSLCHTCRYATIVRGPSQRDEIIECSLLSADSARITFSVCSCSNYSDRRLPSLRDMEDIAWILRSDAKRREIGFVRSRDLKPRERIYFEEE